MAVRKLTHVEYNALHHAEKLLYYDESTGKVSKLVGDINRDGTVNAADIVSLIRFALGVDPLSIPEARLLDFKGKGMLSMRELLVFEREFFM